MEKNETKTFSIPSSRYGTLRNETSGQAINLNLTALRLMTDSTRVEVANFIRINRETYSNYEKGKCQVPSNIILRLADMYEIPIDLIFGRTDTPIVKEFYEKNVGGKK